MNPVCGGASNEQVATPEVQRLCDKVKVNVETKAGMKYKIFVAKSYTTQVVAGTKYFIKVHVGDKDYVHLSVFQSLPHAGGKVELLGVQTRKTLADPLSMF